MKKPLPQLIVPILLTFAIQRCIALEWEPISIYPTNGDLSAVAYGNGIVAAGGNRGFIYSEDNGSTWTRVPGRDLIRVTDIKFGNGVFVATALDNQALLSIDGKNWSNQTVGVSNLLSLVFGNGLFVAGASSGSIAVSQDGKRWNVYSGIASQSLNMAAFGNDRFVLKEFGTDTVLVSTNGTNWVRQTGVVKTRCRPGPFPPMQQCQLGSMIGLTFGANAFYAHIFWTLLNERAFLRSTDGITWTETTTLPPNYPAQFPNQNDLHFSGGRFFRLGTSESSTYPAAILTSPDMVNWSTNVFPAYNGVYSTLAVTTVNSTHIVVGGSGLVLRGQDPNSLTRIDSPLKNFGAVSVAAKGDRIVVAGNVAPGLAVSTNHGRTFALARPIPTSSTELSKLTRFLSGRFVAIGGYGQMYQSTDGVDWQVVALNSNGRLNDITTAGQTWIGVGYSSTGDGVIVTSTNDGVDFAPQISGVTRSLNCVTFGDGKFVIAGDFGTMLTSTNAIDWVSQIVSDPDGFRPNFNGIAYGNGKFVAVGSNGRIFISSDAANWSSAFAGSFRGSFGRIAFAHGLFVAIAQGTWDAYVSSDGSNWLRTTAFDGNLQDVTVADGEFLLCGAAPNGTGPMIFRERQDTPIRFESIAKAVDGADLNFDFRVFGNYRITTATDLFGPWQSLDVLTNALGERTLHISDTSGQLRFYRATRE